MSIFSDRLWNIWSFNSCEYLPFHKLESIWSFPQSHLTLRSNIKTSKVVYVIQTLFSYISTHASHTLHSPSIFSASCILFHPYIKCTPWFHWLQDSCYIKVFISFSLLEEQFQLFSVLWITHSTNPFFLFLLDILLASVWSPNHSLCSGIWMKISHSLGMCHIVSKFPQCIYFVLLSYIWLPCALITNFQIILFVFYQICFY